MAEPPAKRHKAASSTRADSSSSSSARLELSLAQLVDGCDANPFQFRGTILATRPYNKDKQTGGLVLKAPDGTTRDVAFRGKWCQQLAFTTGQRVRFYGDGATIEKTSQEKKNAPGWQAWRVAYRKGVKGDLLDSDGDENGHFQYGTDLPGPSTLKKKVQESPERTEWGLKLDVSPKHKRHYLPMASVVPEKGKFSLIVIALHAAEPAVVPNSRTADYRSKFKFIDPTSESSPLTANLFGQTADDVPTVERGSIVLFQAVSRGAQELSYNQVTGYKGAMLFAVFSPAELLANSVVAPVYKPVGKSARANFGKEEVAYARDLAVWWKKHGGLLGEDEDEGEQPKDAKEISKAVARGGGARAGRPLLKIEDLQVGEFCDIIAIVVKKFDGMSGGLSSDERTTLYVSDYTSHDEMMDYEYGKPGDKWPGPWGARTLQVTCWGANHHAASKLTPRTPVFLRNLRIKIGTGGLLEATLHGDKKFPNRADVLPISQNDHEKMKAVHEIMGRLKDYWTKHAIETGAPVPVTPSPHKPKSNVAPPSRIAAAAVSPRAGPSVVCSLPRTAPDSLEAMMISETDAMVFKLRGRVVDFAPARLQDWIVASCPVCQADIPDSCVKCLDHNQVQLQYYFHLAIAEEPSAANDFTSPCDWISITPSSLPNTSSNIFPDLPATASMRDGSSDLDLLRERLEPILGKIETAKRHKKAIAVEDYGPAFDFAVFRAKNREGRWTNDLHETSFVA
ncbi:hypothetical protein RQP46_007038 [Phenoliferia psychrophenolica]